MSAAQAAEPMAPPSSQTADRAPRPRGDTQVDPTPGPVVLRFAPLPGHVRTARLVAVALARRVGVEDGLLDEVRLAVGEACSRAVGLHRVSAPNVPIVVRLHDGRERFGVEVIDAVSGGPVPKRDDGAPDDLGDADDGADMGLAVLRGLVDDIQVTLTGDGGVIRMGWPVGDPLWAG